MIYIIPFAKYEIKSALKKEMIIERFCQSITLLNTLPLAKSTGFRDFEGVKRREEFTFRRVVNEGYSAFLPILTYEIEETNSELSLKVRIHFHTGVNIVLALFFVFQIITFESNLISISVSLVLYLFVLYLFNKEVHVLKETLNKIVR